MSAPIDHLQRAISKCDICRDFLPHGPRPIVQFSSEAQLLIIGQAPGLKVHKSGVPWDDPSGRLLRMWLQLSDKTFYDPRSVALLPMGFCFPGKGKSGDLPPRKECAPKWHDQILEWMPSVELTLLIGSYAQKHYLPGNIKNLTTTVRNFQQYLPQYLPLPHPSPRNRPWLHKNAWFENSLLPVLRHRVRDLGMRENEG